MSDDDLYYKIFDTLRVLRDVRDDFSTYSAQDIKKLVASKQRRPLKKLYRLEAMITDLREASAKTHDASPPMPQQSPEHPLSAHQSESPAVAARASSAERPPSGGGHQQCSHPSR